VKQELRASGRYAGKSHDVRRWRRPTGRPGRTNPMGGCGARLEVVSFPIAPILGIFLPGEISALGTTVPPGHRRVRAGYAPSMSTNATSSRSKKMASLPQGVASLVAFVQDTLRRRRRQSYNRPTRWHPVHRAKGEDI
jgi:hypothetical protein